MHRDGRQSVVRGLVELFECCEYGVQKQRPVVIFILHESKWDRCKHDA